MKKKLLSLVLAGAMVASTSVSAFAATSNGVTTDEVTIGKGETEKEIQIGIQGNILNEDGNTVPGTISVTVPTATTFSVNAKTGELNSPDMTITNNGEEQIKVTASKFEDSNGREKINIIKKSEFEAENKGVSDHQRGTVWLRLTGDSQNLGLTSESNGSGNGKMYDNDYNIAKTAGDNYEIGQIKSKGTMTLKLEGKGGIGVSDNNSIDTAIQDDFKLVLKISRA